MKRIKSKIKADIQNYIYSSSFLVTLNAIVKCGSTISINKALR